MTIKERLLELNKKINELDMKEMQLKSEFEETKDLATQIKIRELYFLKRDILELININNEMMGKLI